MGNLPEPRVTPSHSSVTIDQQPSKTSSRAPPRRSKRLLSNILLSLLLMFTLCLSPSYQQNQANFNVTSLAGNRGLFFDKISDLRYIKDDWKLVVYYNMSTYWQGVTNIKKYITHIKQSSAEHVEQYHSLILQLEQEMREIDHFNNIIDKKYLKRQKRGLINGVGYLANSLFGVLDERFAEQYKEDIDKITSNENHLQQLLKNQTTVIESEYNILRRNEEVMVQQFKHINEHIKNNTIALNHVILDTNSKLNVLTAALTANIIISNIRRMQQTIIDTVTDISHGHIDPHLILPEELQDQLNIISGQLQGDLMLPVDSKNIKDIYNLLKISARIVSNYLIIEIRIPLVSTDLFELDKIITVPQRQGSKSYRITPAYPYLAYNLHKDLAFLLSEYDLQTCLHIAQIKILLCSLNMPLYQLKLKQSLCDIKLLDADKSTTACSTTITTCEDNWIKLHESNDWLFSCCEECHVRIYCTRGVTIEEMKGSGIINIGKGCKIRSSSFSLYAHNNYMSHTNVQQNMKVPEVSILNTVINTSLPESTFQYQGHDLELWNELRAQIDNIKGQSSNELSVHDIHHYSLLYVILSCILIAGISIVIVRLRRRCWVRPREASSLPDRSQLEMQSCESVSERVNVPSGLCKSNEVVPSEVKISINDIPKSANKATSPAFIRSRPS